MRRWIVTFGGAGMSPVAPGTAGSLAASVVLLVYYVQVRPAQAGWSGFLIGFMALASVLAVILGPWAHRHYGKKDPGSFVLDEVAGICLATLGTPMMEGSRQGLVLLATFVAFRIFDVWKPWPCRRLEMLPGGWGILVDDLCAAVYANLLCQVVLRLIFKL